MIVSETHRFVIATPVKTATKSIESAARRGGLRQVKPLEHRMGVPKEYEDYDRFIMVRNPWARLPSVYEWLRRDGNKSQWPRGHQAATEPFGAFLRFYAVARGLALRDRSDKRLVNGRAPHMWVDSYGTLESLVAGRLMTPAPGRSRTASCTPLRVEDMTSGLTVNGYAFPPVPRNNVTTQRVHTDWRDYWTEDLIELGWKLCGDDFTRYGYPELFPDWPSMVGANTASTSRLSTVTSRGST